MFWSKADGFPVVSFRRFHPDFRQGASIEINEDEETRSMRLKLVIGASSLAAIAGAGSCIGIVQAAFSSLKPFSSPGLLVGATFLLPAASISFASIFVYRHTARRRKLQALLTALVATILTLCFFIGAYILNARRNPTPPNETPGPLVARDL